MTIPYGGRCFKLRFRHGQRQVVRYIGTDDVMAGEDTTGTCRVAGCPSAVSKNQVLGARSASLATGVQEEALSRPEFSGLQVPWIRGASASPESQEEPKLAQLRLERLQQYQEKALQHADALQASVGAAAAELMLMGFRFSQGIDEVLSSCPDLLKRFENLAPVMDVYLRVTRQWDRLVKVNQELSAGKRTNRMRRPK